MNDVQPRLLGKYNGSPCRTCGGVLRYERNGGCVACVRRRSKEKKSAAKAGTTSLTTKQRKAVTAKRAAWRNYCVTIAKAAVHDRPIEQALKLEAVRDLLLAWGALEQPTETRGLDDTWGGL